LGGASWPRFGPDGAWADSLASEGLAVSRLRPSNCGFQVAWSDHMRTRFAGEPLKTIALTFATHRVRGEAVITNAGLEGGAIYALSPMLREAIDTQGEAMLRIDLLPDTNFDEVARRLSAPRGKQSLANALRKTLSLSSAAIALAQEATKGKLGALSPDPMAALLKAVPVTLTGIASIDRAISTAGGIGFDEIDESFMLKKRPGVFVAGEMLDWEAPTGGYLLQACFATGVAAGEGAVRYLARLNAARPA
ncbi:MAG: TIGR03862 family flavoprotein, partial [Pseudorhodoplanes sp.]